MPPKTLTKAVPSQSFPVNRQAKIHSLANSLLVETNKSLERKKFMYKDVLTYPGGTDHLKYFEKIPHPEKFSPALLGILETKPKDDLNLPLDLKKIEFEMVKKKLAGKLSDIDIKLMRLPERLLQMKKEEWFEKKDQAYEHLRRCFYNFFTSPIDEKVRPDIVWIDYKFATDFGTAENALNDLKNNIFNDKAKAKLIEKLKEAKAFGNGRKDFYFWNSSPYDWPELSFQARSVKFDLFFNDTLRSIRYLGSPPQYASLGFFTLNTLPEGYVEPLGNDKYKICVNKAYVFVNDKFNFDGDEYLSSWDLHPVDDIPILTCPYFYTPLFNKDFREFRRHGYGADFPVLSRLHEIENFQPQCMEYNYAK